MAVFLVPISSYFDNVIQNVNSTTFSNKHPLVVTQIGLGCIQLRLGFLLDLYTLTRLLTVEMCFLAVIYINIDLQDYMLPIDQAANQQYPLTSDYRAISSRSINIG